MKTIIYIDGFNLYYRMLKQNPEYRWLNLVKLCEEILPQNNIQGINYYTARASDKVKQGTSRRQQIYFKTLATLPRVSIHLGNFMVSKKWAGLVHPPKFLPSPTLNILEPVPDVVKVQKIEEKGSDVNLASHLIRDAFRGHFDVAAVLTNDTDLVEPMRIVKEEIGLPVGLISPVSKPAESLKNVSSFIRRIKETDLRNSQFPDKIPNTDLERPASWKAT